MIAGKKVLGLVPARGGSKRISSKNLRKLGDKSLLEITVEQALSSTLIDKVVVSSEDPSILHAAEDAGACTLVRPASLACDDTPGITPVIHALQVFDSFEYIVLLQVTSPFRLVEDIDGAIRRCSDKHSLSCVSVCRPQQHPAWMFNVDEKGVLQPFQKEMLPLRSQDLPLCYALNGAIYVAEREAVISLNSFISEDTIPYEMPADRSLDIDTDYDLQLARVLWGLQQN